MSYLNKRYIQLVIRNYDALKKEYISALFGLHEWLEFSYMGQKITAMITGIGEFGHLHLKTRDSADIICDLKEITFIL